MSNRFFKERLELKLNEWGVPPRMQERVDIFSDITNIKKPKARNFLDGIVHGNDPDIERVANKLEVDPEWLLGKSDHQHSKSNR